MFPSVDFTSIKTVGTSTLLSELLTNKNKKMINIYKNEPRRHKKFSPKTNTYQIAFESGNFCTLYFYESERQTQYKILQNFMI